MSCKNVRVWFERFIRQRTRGVYNWSSHEEPPFSEFSLGCMRLSPWVLLSAMRTPNICCWTLSAGIRFAFIRLCTSMHTELGNIRRAPVFLLTLGFQRFLAISWWNFLVFFCSRTRFPPCQLILPMAVDFFPLSKFVSDFVFLLIPSLHFAKFRWFLDKLNKDLTQIMHFLNGKQTLVGFRLNPRVKFCLFSRHIPHNSSKIYGKPLLYNHLFLFLFEIANIYRVILKHLFINFLAIPPSNWLIVDRLFLGIVSV